MYTLYVLRSEKDANLYIGCTGNVETRLIEHNKGNVFSTKSRRPFILIYTEEYLDKYEAFHKEKFYKTVKGRRELMERMYNCPIV